MIERGLVRAQNGLRLRDDAGNGVAPGAYFLRLRAGDFEATRKIVRARYSTKEWNIYAAQASDGENYSGDSARCVSLLNDEVMRLCQYYAYVEILDEREIGMFMNSGTGAELWRNYQQVAGDWSNFAMKRVADPGDIYPVFRELFAKQESRT